MVSGKEKMTGDARTEEPQNIAFLLRDEVESTVRFFYDTLSALPQAAIVLDRGGKVKYVNNYAADLMEHSREEMINRDFDHHMMEIFSLSLVQAFLSAIESALNDDMACQKLLVSGKRKEKRFVGELTVKPLHLKDHTQGAALLLLEEKTQWVLMEETLSKNSMLDQAGTMAIGVAHQMRNNLQSIQSLLELMEWKFAGDNRVFKEYSDMIHSELDSANVIVTQLLQVSHYQDLTLAPVEINGLCHEVITLMRATLMNKKIVIQENYSDAMPELTLDHFRIKQVIVNLIRNAVDALAGSGTICVSTKYNFGLNQAEIAITDDGVGMDEITLEKIRQPFFTTKENGNGVGLAVCRRMLADQGGYLKVESVLGQGSTFTIVLPEVAGQGAQDATCIR